MCAKDSPQTTEKPIPTMMVFPSKRNDLKAPNSQEKNSISAFDLFSFWVPPEKSAKRVEGTSLATLQSGGNESFFHDSYQSKRQANAQNRPFEVTPHTGTWQQAMGQARWKAPNHCHCQVGRAAAVEQAGRYAGLSRSESQSRSFRSSEHLHSALPNRFALICHVNEDSRSKNRWFTKSRTFQALIDSKLKNNGSI